MDLTKIPLKSEPLDYPEREDWVEVRHCDMIVASMAALRGIAYEGVWRAFVWPHDEEAELLSGEFDPLIVDMLTARAMVAVYDALSPENQAKFAAQVADNRGYFGQLVDFCWSRVSLKR